MCFVLFVNCNRRSEKTRKFAKWKILWFAFLRTLKNRKTFFKSIKTLTDHFIFSQAGNDKVTEPHLKNLPVFAARSTLCFVSPASRLLASDFVNLLNVVLFPIGRSWNTETWSEKWWTSSNAIRANARTRHVTSCDVTDGPTRGSVLTLAASVLNVSRPRPTQEGMREPTAVNSLTLAR